MTRAELRRLERETDVPPTADERAHYRKVMRRRGDPRGRTVDVDQLERESIAAQRRMHACLCGFAMRLDLGRGVWTTNPDCPKHGERAA
ncbi:MAG: hypothetical protein AB7T31_19010 [Gemmatimonadales bacterium]